MPLATPADSAKLEALNKGNPEWHQILNTEDPKGASAWRCIEVLSDHPCQLRLSWSVGGAAIGKNVLVTCPSGVRIGVFARSLRVEACNITFKENRVRVSTADAHVSGDNVFEEVGTGSGDFIDHVPPPFAEAVAVGADVADPSTEVEIEVYDSTDTCKFSYKGDKHQDGAYIGACERVAIKVTSDARYRVAWILTI